MLRWGSDRYQRIFDAPDHDLSSVFLRLREVVGGLRPQPRLGPPPKAFSRRIAISADIPALPLTRLFIACRVTPNTFAASVTESPRGSRQSCRTDNPGWGGFFMRIVGALVVVNEIHTVGAAVPETENDPSVVRHKRETRTFYFFESAWSISMCARCASTENSQAVFFCIHWGAARLSFTARIERPQPYRGGSASTKDSLATPQSLLLLNLRPPYNVLVTPWLCDCFLSFAVAQRIRSECGLSIRRASGLQRS